LYETRIEPTSSYKHSGYTYKYPFPRNIIGYAEYLMENKDNDFRLNAVDLLALQQCNNRQTSVCEINIMTNEVWTMAKKAFGKYVYTFCSCFTIIMNLFLCFCDFSCNIAETNNNSNDNSIRYPYYSSLLLNRATRCFQI
jgi:hypothetical protein